jgi:DNA repair protein RecN (Recombination protein N)
VLEELRITDLGVIDDAVIEFGSGLNAVSGETGAGKTMVVSGLGLLLGARSDAGLVRAGSDRAAVEGIVRVGDSPAMLTKLAELDADVEDGAVVVSRVVKADGRSRAYVGGRTVPVGVLAELMAGLVAVHGQAEQQRLRQTATHRKLLDKYAGDAVTGPLSAYTATYDEHCAVVAELHDVTTRRQERAREADALRFGLDEIAAVSPAEDEDAALANDIVRLSHVDVLMNATETARRSLLGDDASESVTGAQHLVAQAHASIASASTHDPALVELTQRLREIEVLLSDVGADISSYASGLDADPARLAVSMDRQALLSRLIRKYAEGDTGLAGVLAWSRAAAARLSDLDDDDDRVTRLEADSARLHAQMVDRGDALTKARRTAGKRLERAVAGELRGLAMADAQVVVSVAPAEAGPNGADHVEMLLAAHAGAPMRSIQKAASGGELSRIMLALEVVLAGRDSFPTFVFDEVDAGVGGRAAAEIGRRLAALAQSAQVIVVTHLPQIAAFADRHLLVEKSAGKRGTVASDVITLDTPDRVVELSRMLAGQADSDLARGHAEELLAAAAAHRTTGGS